MANKGVRNWAKSKPEAVLTFIGMIVLALWTFWGTQGAAGDALVLARQNEKDLKAHCDVAIKQQAATAVSISDIKLSVAGIEGEINSINTMLSEREKQRNIERKQDTAFREDIIYQLRRLKPQ